MVCFCSGGYRSSKSEQVDGTSIRQVPEGDTFSHPTSVTFKLFKGAHICIIILEYLAERQNMKIKVCVLSSYFMVQNG